MSPIFSTFSLGSGNRRRVNPLSSFSYVTANSTTTRNITVPASAQADDFAIYMHTNAGNYGDIDASDSYLPAGWTRVYRNAYVNATNDDSVYDVAWKKLVSGDVSSSITVASTGGSDLYGRMFIYRPDNPFNTVTMEDSNHQVGDVNPSSQNIDGTAVSTLPQLLFATYFAGTNSSLGTLTWSGGTGQTTSTINGSFAITYRMYNVGDTTQNVTVDMGIDGFDHTRLASHILSFA